MKLLPEGFLILLVLERYIRLSSSISPSDGICVVWQRQEHQQVAGVGLPAAARRVISCVGRCHRDCSRFIGGERDLCPCGI